MCAGSERRVAWACGSERQRSRKNRGDQATRRGGGGGGGGGSF